MGHVEILETTTKNPITHIGFAAGICWGGKTDDPEINYERGLDCIKSNHGRTIECVMIDTVISGYSARVIREWYTHIGGLPTRLGASTRYINYENFEYVTPNSISTSPEATKIYDDLMSHVSETITSLRELGVPNEDASLSLTLAYCTKLFDHRNARNVMDMSRTRMCKRANHEYRKLFMDYITALSNYSDEWSTFIKMTMMPTCKKYGRCFEKKPCPSYKYQNWVNRELETPPNFKHILITIKDDNYLSGFKTVAGYYNGSNYVKTTIDSVGPISDDCVISWREFPHPDDSE